MGESRRFWLAEQEIHALQSLASAPLDRVVEGEQHGQDFAADVNANGDAIGPDDRPQFGVATDWEDFHERLFRELVGVHRLGNLARERRLQRQRAREMYAS